MGLSYSVLVRASRHCGSTSATNGVAEQHANCWAAPPLRGSRKDAQGERAGVSGRAWRLSETLEGRSGRGKEAAPWQLCLQN